MRSPVSSGWKTCWIASLGNCRVGSASVSPWGGGDHPGTQGGFSSTSLCPTSTRALRVRMRKEVRALHDRIGATSVYVTHDQIEAMTMADHVVVLQAGADRTAGAADGVV